MRRKAGGREDVCGVRCLELWQLVSLDLDGRARGRAQVDIGIQTSRGAVDEKGVVAAGNLSHLEDVFERHPGLDRRLIHGHLAAKRKDLDFDTGFRHGFLPSLTRVKIARELALYSTAEGGGSRRG